jgi:hypothetical protein
MELTGAKRHLLTFIISLAVGLAVLLLTYNLLQSKYEKDLAAYEAAKAQRAAFLQTLTDTLILAEVPEVPPQPDEDQPLELAASASILLTLSTLGICYFVLFRKRPDPDS